MTMRGTVNTGAWTVEAMTSPMPQGGFGCNISITQSSPELVGHAFAHRGTYDDEVAAVLDGLREGMLWIEVTHPHISGV